MSEKHAATPRQVHQAWRRWLYENSVWIDKASRACSYRSMPPAPPIPSFPELERADDTCTHRWVHESESEFGIPGDRCTLCGSWQTPPTTTPEPK